MDTRSSNNWTGKSGTWDALNIEHLNFHTDYPLLNSIIPINHFETVICNNYKAINANSLVNMFVEDYMLERFWNNPSKYIDMFSGTKAVMSPDYSLFLGMPKPMLIWNVYRNRLVGHVWQQAGINVIPTISWTDESSFDFCFEGVAKGSVVAVSNIGCRNDSHKQYFDNGFKRMQEVIQPRQILFQCNNKYICNYLQDNVIFVKSYWDLKRKQ